MFHPEAKHKKDKTILGQNCFEYLVSDFQITSKLCFKCTLKFFLFESYLKLRCCSEPLSMTIKEVTT